ncbi:hypothetical protein JW752_05195 [Candidatus Peregrinibacteria bacterium]|nr:hypothetical protein [Candidatus Peregrinibacteria bacterium]
MTFRKFLSAFVLALTFFIFGWYGHKFFGHLDERHLKEVKPHTSVAPKAPKKRVSGRARTKQSMKLDAPPLDFLALADVPETESVSDRSTLPPTPQQLVQYLLDEVFTFVGVDPPPPTGEGSTPGYPIPTCLFRVGDVLVHLNYCTSNHESLAAGIEVYTNSGWLIEFYADTGTYDKPVSRVGREDYVLLRVEANRLFDPVDLDMGLPEFHGSGKPRRISTCSISNVMADCTDPTLSVWKSSAEAFHKNPGADWFSLLKKLRDIATIHGQVAERYYE